MLLINFIISLLLLLDLKQILIQNQPKTKDPREFLSQTLFWLIIGLVIIFIPPAVITVDSQQAFSFLRLREIDQLTWSSPFWMGFYRPPLYMFLVIPITIFILFYGIAKLLI